MITWYLAVVGWGWLFVNEIRILLVAGVAPKEAQKAKNEQDEEREQRMDCPVEGTECLRKVELGVG